MTTVDTLVRQTKEKLTGVSGRGRISFLFGGITDVATTAAIGIGDPALGPQTVLGIEYERILVITNASQTAISAMARGMFGTTPAAHASSTIVEIEPRWPNDVVLTEIGNELRSWPDELYATTSVDLSFPAGIAAVDLTGSSGLRVHRILDATVLHTGGGGSRLGRLSVQLHRELGASFASGHAVALTDPRWTYGEATTVRVTYAHSFDVSVLTPATDLETTVGVAASMLDIIPLGVGVRMMAGKDAERNDLGAQGQQRNAAEVPPQSWAKSASLWQQMREARISQEITRLLNDSPWRMQ